MTSAAPLFPTIDGLEVSPNSIVLQRRPLHPTFDPANASQFGDDFWDLTPAAHLRHNKLAVNWKRFPREFRTAVKLYAFALINVVDGAPRLADTANNYPALSSILLDLRYLRPFTIWLSQCGHNRFDQISQDALDDYARHVLAEDISPATKRTRLTSVMRLSAYRNLLPEDCRLPSDRHLWGAASAAQIVGVPFPPRLENATPRIDPDIMSGLLSAALLTVEVVGQDVLDAAVNLLAMRRLVYEALSSEQREPRGKPDVHAATARFEALVSALRSADLPLPGTSEEGAGLDLEGIAVCILTNSANLVDKGRLVTRISQTKEPVAPGLLQVTEFSECRGRQWRQDPVGARELLTLVKHVVAACLVITAYLSGVRLGEALNLKRGCISRSKALDLVFLSGSQEKTGPNRRERSPASIPWIVTEQVATAVTLLEQLAPGDLLFPFGNVYAPESFQHASSRSMLATKASERVRSFIKWFNDDIASNIGHEKIPDDPRGPITVSRFRRTLAWHIVRRPGGLVAGALQYGHLHTQLTQGYAGRADAGFTNEIGFEEFLLRCETVHADHERLESGERVSGPAARSYVARVAAGSCFLGHAVTSPAQAKALLANEDLQIHHGAFMTCVYRPETAACREDTEQADGPLLPKCKPNCANIARTDRDIGQLENHNHELLTDTRTAYLPLPLRTRIAARMTASAEIVAQHRLTAATAPELRK